MTSSALRADHSARQSLRTASHFNFLLLCFARASFKNLSKPFCLISASDIFGPVSSSAWCSMSIWQAGNGAGASVGAARGGWKSASRSAHNACAASSIQGAKTASPSAGARAESSSVRLFFMMRPATAHMCFLMVGSPVRPLMGTQSASLRCKTDNAFFLAAQKGITTPTITNFSITDFLDT